MRPRLFIYIHPQTVLTKERKPSYIKSYLDVEKNLIDLSFVQY